MAKWKKNNPYGDYRDPLQNHKFDIVVTNKEGEVVSAKNAHKILINQARWYYGKHVGSKRMKNLLSFVNKGNAVRKMLKSYKKSIEKADTKLNNENNQEITDAEIIA